MTYPTKGLLAGIIFIFLFQACKSDSKEAVPNVSSKSLIGEWNLITAKKSGQVTNLLDNALFRFDTNGNLTTNLGGEDTTLPYSLSDNKISVPGATPDEYNVLKVTADTLILSARLAKFDFEFVTLKNY